MGNKRTNSLRAAALSIGVREDLLEAVAPLLRNDMRPNDVGFAIMCDLKRLSDENALLKKEAAALREVNGEAEKLAALFDELMLRLRSNPNGKAFIAVPHEGVANFSLLHSLENQHTRLKASRVRLVCAKNKDCDCGCASEEKQETSGS